MASCASMKGRFSEIATCPICLDDFKDPRSLPCVHAFCFHCLQDQYKNNFPGDGVPCPLCKKEFQIPQDGLPDLPHNFFLQNLVDAKSIKQKPGTYSCEPCSGDGRTKTATVYCVDCSQKLCDRCSVPHKNWRGGPHDVRAMGDELGIGLKGMHGSYCDLHPDKPLKSFCIDCRINICMKCTALSHQQHRCEEIETVAEDFAASIKSDIKPIPSRISRFREAIKQVERANKQFLKNIEKIELEVQRTRNEMIRLLDDHVDKLMQELNEIKTSSVEESEARVEGFELALTALESFQAYSSQLASKGSLCDITRAVDDLHARAEELLKTCVTSGDYYPPEISFVSTNVDKTLAGKYVIGYLQASTVKPKSAPRTQRAMGPSQLSPETTNTENVRQKHLQSDPQVVYKIPKAEVVRGVTLLNDALYVLRQREVSQVDVYSTSADFALLRRLSVNGLSTGMTDITSCAQKQCIYIADWGHTCIHRVALDESVSSRAVTEKPRGLSVTPSLNLLVTCRDVYGQNGILVELSGEDGTLVQMIELQSDIQWLEHGIQLASNQYVVCHDGGVSLIESDGRARPVSGKDLQGPCYMAVDDDDFVFVADKGNDRIVLLDPSLNYMQNVINQYRPRRLCFDDVTRRMYLGPDGGSVSVVQM